MKERPLILGAPMVCATLDGRKTNTRRIIKPQPEAKVHQTLNVISYKSGKNSVLATPEHFLDYMPTLCPYGRVGDRLWVREAFRYPLDLDKKNSTQIAKDCLGAEYEKPWCPTEYCADGRRDNWDCWDEKEAGRYRHARFMPRWALRLTLEITDVRVERLQDISDEDAIAEGIERISQVGFMRACGWKDYGGGIGFFSPIDSFRSLWESIHGEGAWEINPWVFALTFKKIEL